MIKDLCFYHRDGQAESLSFYECIESAPIVKWLPSIWQQVLAVLCYCSLMPF